MRITIEMVDNIYDTMCPRSAICALESMRCDATDDEVIEAIDEALYEAYACTRYLFN